MLAKELSTLLAQRCEDVVRELLPNGEKKSGEWCIGSVGGEKGDSMKVRLAGAKVGVWADFATGESGDLLDLWALIKHQTISQAMNDICEYFNILPKKHELKGKQKSFVKPPVRAVETIKKESAAYVYLAQRRCLQDDTIRLYGIPNSDSELIFNYIRDKELIFVKTLKIERKDGKKDIHVSANCEPCLFGWNMIPKNARKVVICEGEIDAMSFFEYGIPALSVPFGGGRGDKQRWLDYEIDNLNRFDEIFICMDNDDAGIEGAREIIGRLGAHRCRVIQLPMKDANECLVNGISTEDIKYFIDNAKTFDPEELVFHDGFTDLTYEFMNPKPGSFEGYTLGWSYFDESILFRPSGLTMWTGYNGHGKTMFLSQVMLNMIKQGARICIASLELYPTELCARMYIQAAAMEHPSRGFMGAIDQWIDGKLMLFNLVGTAKIDRMLEVFLYARRRYGVDVFIVDSLTTLNIAEDDYNGQK
jgi:twinkle protein